MLALRSPVYFDVEESYTESPYNVFVISSYYYTKSLRITPHNVCRWISMFTTIQMLPNMTDLAILGQSSYVKIPINSPVTKKHDVVTCISPLFANEQWQFTVLAAHTYKR
uniref:Uncharacterized protein n=1 Tax=Heterorhabditis bacteriophora TaxID=37862 RepID=A0A1I7XHK0_HETBA